MSETKQIFGRCIICRKENVLLSDEHIIPDALGGVSHCYQICKDCNSKLGDSVDIGIVDSPLARMERFSRKLAGKSGKIPNPFDGTYTDADGHKVRLEVIDGKFIPRMIPSVEVDTSSNTLHVAIDERDKKQLGDIINKTVSRNSLKLQGTGETKVVTTQNPSVTISQEISLNAIRLGLLKIAYESTVELIPEYYDDPIAINISSILRDAAQDRIDEIQMTDGFQDVFNATFSPFIDFSKGDRHFVFLLNVSNHLYCYIKLFNLYSIVVEMSEKHYPAVGFGKVLINDIIARKEYRLSLEDLIAKTNAQTSLSFSFKTRAKSAVEGVYCTPDYRNIVFNASRQPICTLDDLLRSIPEDQIKETGVIDGEFSTKYTINDGYFLMGSPSKELLPLDVVTVTSHIEKF